MSKAYTKEIGAIGSGAGENGLIHQSSPAWVLTFVRWENRDTFRNTTVPFSQVRGDLLVVESDCVSLSVSQSKGTLTPSFQATFFETDVNYMTATAPGDFVFINILNSESDAREVAIRAKNGNAINRVEDGFKGFFKVQSVRKSLSVDPETGIKNVLVRIDGFGFTEFNNTIYFNPNLLAAGAKDNLLLFIRHFSDDFKNLVKGENGFFNIQDILALLILSFIGSGINTINSADALNKTLSTGNTHFYMPLMVGNLLGIKSKVTAAKDVYTYLFGIQTYISGAKQSLGDGFNPVLSSDKNILSGFKYTSQKCAGTSLFKAEYWNGTKAWSIMQQYINSPLNEMYTCFRVSNNNHILPTLVLRQTPFTNSDFRSRNNINDPVTLFLTLPRWKISPAIVLNFDIGRDEAARTNYVQYNAKMLASDGGFGASMETAAGNYVYDKDDVQRNGLRPSLITSPFDPVPASLRSPNWAKIVGDAVIGSHLRLNGSITCMGIIDPITVGDNLEFDNIVFHIESVTHSCSVSQLDGKKQFMTIIRFSNGISKTDKNVTKYAEMNNTNAYINRSEDYKNSKILPGISESQDTMGRVGDIDRVSDSNGPFVQPDGSKK